MEEKTCGQCGCKGHFDACPNKCQVTDVKLPRYMLFGSACFYAFGGVKDLVCCMNDLEEVTDIAKTLYDNGAVEWYHIYDSITLSVIKKTHDAYEGHISNALEYMSGWDEYTDRELKALKVMKEWKNMKEYQ